MLEGQKTVFIIDDDVDFAEIIQQILVAEGQWNVTRIFSDIESLLAFFPQDLEEAQMLVPDLMVVDIFSSREPPTEIAPLTGFHAMLILRDTGLEFGSLLISSMSTPALLPTLRAKHPQGWAYLVKSTALKSETVLQAAREALIL